MIQIICALMLAVPPVSSGPPPQLVKFGNFGSVRIYKGTAKPKRMALVLSGASGWDATSTEMAMRLAGQEALVAGVDLAHYASALTDDKKSKCSYPPGDLEALSQYLEKRFEFVRYELPVIVGQGEGATLAYATLAQSPPNTFRGAISASFCPQLEMRKPLCKSHQLEWADRGKAKKGPAALKPVANLGSAWTVLEGTADKVCTSASVEAFVKQIKTAKVIDVLAVEHNFGQPAIWGPVLQQEFVSMTAPPVESAPMTPSAAGGAVASPPGPDDVQDLPTVEMPLPATPNGTLAIVISGDGGWASIDRELAGVLVEKGVAVVGLNSLQYFWKARTAEQTARDVARLMRHYLAGWNKQHLWLVGYSRGADALPFVANRLPPDLMAKVGMVAMIAPGKTASFEFHVTDWLGGGDEGQPLLPEIQRLVRIPVLCVFGKDEETDSVCPLLDAKVFGVLPQEGAHHFNGNYRPIAEEIAKRAK